MAQTERQRFLHAQRNSLTDHRLTLSLDDLFGITHRTNLGLVQDVQVVQPLRFVQYIRISELVPVAPLACPERSRRVQVVSNRLRDARLLRLSGNSPGNYRDPRAPSLGCFCAPRSATGFVFNCRSTMLPHAPPLSCRDRERPIIRCPANSLPALCRRHRPPRRHRHRGWR